VREGGKEGDYLQYSEMGKRKPPLLTLSLNTRV
jgi:hypothetical protein